MTNQEAFNLAWERLVTFADKGKCGYRITSVFGSEFHCLYYDSMEDNKCVVGYMMPDELCKHVANTVDPLRNDIKSVIEDYPGVKAFFSGVDENMLDAIQSVHDINYYDAKNQLKKIAATYKLTCPE